MAQRSARRSLPQTQTEQRLQEFVADFYGDPYGYVLAAFPWQEADGPLENEAGPDEWQTEFLLDLGEKVRKAAADGDDADAIQYALASGHGIGKALPVDSVVPTPAGERRWGDLEPGDLVFGSDGAPTRIKACHYPGVKPFYRVVFDDGTEVEACGEHQWAVRGRQERRNGLPGYRTLTTDDIRHAGVKRKNGDAMARQWEVPIQRAAQFEECEIPLHPYFVGLWLGDGLKGSAAYCKPHTEIRDRVRSVCGYEVRTGADGQKQCVHGVKSLMADPVFERGSHERYIPDAYKFNTVERRYELFRGLCDSDGEVYASGSIGYSTTSRQLAEDVIWLARSLGYKAMMHPKVRDSWYPGEDGERTACRDCYRVTINSPDNPFTHPDRRSAYKPSENRYLVRWIDRIEWIEDKAGMCITVEAEDELYLANDFIVTHNTACIAWVILWFMSTRPHPQVVITAGTKAQLSSKTWREVAKWLRLAINGHWFEWTATTLYHVLAPATWCANAIPWSKANPDAFAGTHEKHVLVVYDEASTIDNAIWETTDGAMTTPGAIWIAFGNPVWASGRFYDCFHRFRHRWANKQIDARTARKANRRTLDGWVADYGEDHDFVRVRVRGVFPRAGLMQMVPSQAVETARQRTIEPSNYLHRAMVAALDVARHGDDESALALRQGAKLHEVKRYRIPDTMQLASQVAFELNQLGMTSVIVEGDGMGWGVVDRLRQMQFDVIAVEVGSRANRPDRFYNRRTELWAAVGSWMKEFADIPDDPVLHDELTSPQYGFDNRERIQLERKEDMKERDQKSPDGADALALTFAETIAANTSNQPDPKRHTNWRA